MRQITESAELVAACGLYCGACGAYLKEKCDGCAKNEKASWCKIRICCKTNNRKSCAECKEFQEVMDCNKFNNFMSKLFALIFKSNRAACVKQIKECGLDGHAKKMADAKQQSIKKS